MSKYLPLWQHIAASKQDELTMSFAEVAAVTGFPLDHSFLSSKKELLDYGWQFFKLSRKEEWVRFTRIIQH